MAAAVIEFYALPYSVWAAAYQLDTEFFESRGPNTRAFCRSVCAVSISFEGEEAISPAFPVDFRFFEDGSFTYCLYEVDGFNPREVFDDTYEQWDLFGCSVDHLIYGAIRDLAKKLPAYRAVSLSAAASAAESEEETDRLAA